jgi:hypothetical protein
MAKKFDRRSWPPVKTIGVSVAAWPLRGRMNSILNWLETHSRWSKLRDLGQSSMVRSSILMPVFGYLLLFNENIRQYLTIQYDAGWPFRYLPSMWRIWMLYYGSCSLAAGSILFAWRCPAEIKQYGSAFEMVDAERHHRTAHSSRIGTISDRLKSLYQSMSTWENSIFKEPRLLPDHPSLGVGSSPDLKSSDHWGLGLMHIWEVSDIKWPGWHIAALSLFRAGLILVSIPAVITFLQVTRFLMKHLFA